MRLITLKFLSFWKNNKYLSGLRRLPNSWFQISELHNLTVTFLKMVPILFDACATINARLITYFGNFVFGFSSLRLRDFPYDVFCLQGKTGKTKWKINKLLCNILVTSSPKTTKNKVTKMWWNAHISLHFENQFLSAQYLKNMFNFTINPFSFLLTRYFLVGKDKNRLIDCKMNLLLVTFSGKVKRKWGQNINYSIHI